MPTYEAPPPVSVLISGAGDLALTVGTTYRVSYTQFTHEGGEPVELVGDFIGHPSGSVSFLVDTAWGEWRYHVPASALLQIWTTDRVHHTPAKAFTETQVF